MPIEPCAWAQRRPYVKTTACAFIKLSAKLYNSSMAFSSSQNQSWHLNECGRRAGGETLNTQFSFAKLGKRITMAAIFLGALGFLAATPSAQADDRRSCQLRIERAEYRLRDAIEDHGYYSHQAFDRRRDLNRERERCWNPYHGYWNGYSHQWRNDRDWDRDDRYVRDRDDRYFRGRNGDRDRDDRHFRDRDRDRDHDRD